MGPFVPGAGLEPARPYGQRCLRTPSLPIPPSRLVDECKRAARSDLRADELVQELDIPTACSRVLPEVRPGSRFGRVTQRRHYLWLPGNSTLSRGLSRPARSSTPPSSRHYFESARAPYGLGLRPLRICVWRISPVPRSMDSPEKLSHARSSIPGFAGLQRIEGGPDVTEENLRCVGPLFENGSYHRAADHHPVGDLGRDPGLFGGADADPDQHG